MSGRELLAWLVLGPLAVLAIAAMTTADGWHKLALHLASALGGH